jgi:hypothetical protein
MTAPFVVQSPADANGLLNELICQSVFERAVVGLDFETTGCDPSKESPVGNARVWCMTVAWGQPTEQTPSPFKTAFVPRAHLERFRCWLENPEWLKVGTNLFGFDRHALKNEGLELRGIHACTSAMSRLLDPGKNAGHGLKAWGERLGYRIRGYKETSTVAVPGDEWTQYRFTHLTCLGCGRRYEKRRKWCKECRPREQLHDDGYRVRGNYVSFVQKELPELWADYPDRRAQIVEYACTDPAMSLDVFHRLKDKLVSVRW